MNTKQSYDALASHYHLIFEDWQSSVERQGEVLRTLLERECNIAPGAEILDCACGIGTQSLGLAQRGFRMTASDLSDAAVNRAREEASQRGLQIDFSVNDMLDLSTLPAARFDAVICMDNSLPHLESAGQLVQAATQIRSRLRPGGWLIASIRDYDTLIEQRPAVHAPSFYNDQGRKRIVFQVWDWIGDRRYIFHLCILRESDDGWQTFHSVGEYRAVPRAEMASALESAGFKEPRWLAPEETGFYQPIVIARNG